MEDLERVWSDNDMEGLPFSTTVNEKRILKIIKTLSEKKMLNDEIYDKVKQWVKFNYTFNEIFHTSSSKYKAFVHKIYLEIDILLKNYGFDTIIDPKIFSFC